MISKENDLSDLERSLFVLDSPIVYHVRRFLSFVKNLFGKALH